MEIVDKPNLYSPDNFRFVFVAVFLYILQTIITLLDTNTYIKEVGISNIGDSIISKAKFYLSYFSGYITYFLKTVVGLIGLWILLTVIRCAFVVIFNIAKPLGEGAKLMEEFRGTMFQKLKTAMKDNATLILGMMFIDRFFVKFLVFGTSLLLVLMVGMAFFLYERKALMVMLEDNDIERVQSTLNTIHHHCMFFLMILIIVLIVSVVRTFVSVYSYENPS